jgi:putative transposase
MIAFIDEHKQLWGVEPICRHLPIAPCTYYAARKRPASIRSRSDERLKTEINRVFEANFRVYGIEKIWRQLRREGFEVGRDQVARLMREIGICGAVRGKIKRTTFAANPEACPKDLVNRKFTAVAPNRCWVADLTYVSTWAGMCYVAFVIDVFSRFIVGWRVSTSLKTDLALDALEMGIWSRQGHDLVGLIHHSDRGVQYLAIRYTERLAEAGAIGSVGSKGDSFDNALAETVNGLFKTELIRAQGPWHTAEEVELATLGWVHWWNQTRLHGACGGIPPAEFEAAYYASLEEGSDRSIPII